MPMHSTTLSTRLWETTFCNLFKIVAQSGRLDFASELGLTLKSVSLYDRDPIGFAGSAVGGRSVVEACRVIRTSAPVHLRFRCAQAAPDTHSWMVCRAVTRVCS